LSNNAILGFVILTLSIPLTIAQARKEVSEVIEENDLIVEGRQVDYIFFPGEPLVVSHGEYRFENKTSQVETCTINSCHFVENGVAVPLSVFYVYAGNTLLERVVSVAPASELEFRVTFPFREVNVRGSYEVRLNVECQGKQYDAASKLNIIQERSHKP